MPWGALPRAPPLLLQAQSSSCPCTTRGRGETAALAVQEVPVPAPTPDRCPPWGTCTPHTPCRIAEKPSCNTAPGKAEQRGIYRAPLALASLPCGQFDPPAPPPAPCLSCVSTQSCHQSRRVSILLLIPCTAHDFQPSACKALRWDLFQCCQEYAARSPVSPGSRSKPLT